MTVTAVEKSTNHSESLVITNSAGRLLKKELEQKKQKMIPKETIHAKNSLSVYILLTKNIIGNRDKEGLAQKLSDSDKKLIEIALSKQQKWLKGNPNADKEDFETSLNYLQKLCDPMILTCSRILKKRKMKNGIIKTLNYDFHFIFESLINMKT